MIDFSSLKCPDCSFISKSKKSFGIHISKMHNKCLEDFTLMFEFNGIKPKCKCGCDNIVLWHKTKNIFNDYILGHSPGNFKTRRPSFSKEMIQKRNDSIRRSAALKRASRKNMSEKMHEEVESVSVIEVAPITLNTSTTSLDDVPWKDDKILCDIIALNSDPNFKLKDDNESIIVREQLIRLNETSLFPDAAGRKYTKDVVLPAVRKFFRDYVSNNGWFYPASKETLSDAVTSIANYEINETSDEVSSLTTSGSDFLKGLFKSYWDVDDGPAQMFNIDKKLDAVLKYRLGLNDSKMYNYTLSDGTQVSCKETFDINIKNVRRGFVVQRAAVSWFKPTAAFEVYKRFIKNIESPVVWDPSCGFGARMLGFYSAFPTGKYIGTDPATKTFIDLNKLSNKLVLHSNGAFDVDIHNIGSEFATSSIITPESVDLVFTSPPYFNKEKYFNEPTQCWKTHDTKEKWIEHYLRPTIKNAYDALKKDSYFVMNIDNENKQDIIDVAIDVGFIQKQSLKLKIGTDHFSKKNGHNTNKFEPILVFVKP